MKLGNLWGIGARIGTQRAVSGVRPRVRPAAARAGAAATLRAEASVRPRKVPETPDVRARHREDARREAR
jgi:hypothetical protein